MTAGGTASAAPATPTAGGPDPVTAVAGAGGGPAAQTDGRNGGAGAPASPSSAGQNAAPVAVGSAAPDSAVASASGSGAVAAPGSPAPVLPGSGAAAPAVAPVHDQVVQVVAPLRTGPDGTYSLTLQLEPQGLGRVVAHVEVAGAQVSVHLTAETAEGHSALSAGMDRLAQSLSRPGSPASVNLGSWAGGGGALGHGGNGPAPDHRAHHSALAPTPAVDVIPDSDPIPARSVDPDRLVDVQL